MGVVLAARIEGGLTGWADGPTRKVLTDGQFVAACPTQNRLLPKLPVLPHLGRMVCLCLMALVTGIVLATTLKLNGADIQRTMVMGTAGLRIDRHALYGDAMNDDPHKGLCNG